MTKTTIMIKTNNNLDKDNDKNVSFQLQAGRLVYLQTLGPEESLECMTIRSNFQVFLRISSSLFFFLIYYVQIPRIETLLFSKPGTVKCSARAKKCDSQFQYPVRMTHVNITTLQRLSQPLTLGQSHFITSLCNFIKDSTYFLILDRIYTSLGDSYAKN